MASGTLYAMMLDTKRTFDRLIERYAPSEKEAQTILNNRLYKHMSNMIAGSQEYMAMERLHEIHEEGKYDFIVLDTPPTRHALDFLEAPRRMVNMTQNSLLKWFLTPSLFAGKVGWGLLQKGAEKILSVLDRLAGLNFLHELAEMISLMGGMLSGFQKRAQSVSDLLHSDACGFVLIASPSEVSIEDARFFHEKIQEENLPFLGFIVNRVHPFLKVGPEGFKATSLGIELKESVGKIVRAYQKLHVRDTQALEGLKRSKKYFFKTIPLLADEVHDLEGLRRMGSVLLG
jgi:anion-transporting  ArsA/GET3 family ATPase